MGIYVGDNEIKGIYLGDTPVKEVYVGTTKVRPIGKPNQGPCPDGFHVPLQTEWTTIKDTGVSLGAWASNGGGNFSSYLKLPGGGRLISNSKYNQNIGYYRCANASGVSGGCGMFSASYIITSAQDRANGLLIRPFKDDAINPISSGSTLKSGWTRLYHSGSNSYGIAHNSSEGLISISSNGTTWYTIKDKNLGATTVYTSGATLSQTNCGYFFQRGNNYGFPYTGATKTSNTQVNAGNYGPGNYYSSDTYIQGFSDWSSVQNDNLRGGQDA